MQRKRIAATFFCLLLLFFLPVIVWYAGEANVLDIVIIDKTVPDASYREHESLVWLLRNQKIVKPDTGGMYDKRVDYYGYFPEREWENRVRSLKTLEKSADLIYIADTYGVYQADLDGENVSGDRSELVYGGITKEEVEVIRKAAYEGAVVVAEFNTFGSPTGYEAREALYDLLGLRWTGWISRYFDDLSPGVEVPDWAVANYQQQQQQNWSYQGSGFVFVDDRDRVIVLEEADVEVGGVSFQWTKEGQAFVGTEETLAYNYWFDIIVPDKADSVLAEYGLRLSESGRSKLETEGIPLTFPAVIRNGTGLYTTYYFAGDFADYPGMPPFYKVAGWTGLMERFSLGLDNRFFWRGYVPLMKQILAEVKLQPHERQLPEGVQLVQDRPVYHEDGTKMVSRTKGRYLQIYGDGQWEDFFVEGVNLGIAFPGRWFTDFPTQESVYMEWFEDIGAMNANSVRVYTLMHPSFYRALLRYNVQHPENPLWLLQEIWPEEHPQENDYLREAYIEAFYKEIEYVVDAVHGNVQIPERRGRAYGDYDADVSSYILGYLVGRELEPEEVAATDKNNDITRFSGDYLRIEQGSPTEVWLAKSCEHVMAYQESIYGWQHPVAIVSWPTLDVMEHDAEWNEEGDKRLEYNDWVSIDIRHFLSGDRMKAGLFGAYHIYPNYPDFMNNTLEYAAYTDDEGVFRYGGYLKHFMEHHQAYPALVAEFGLATGMGNAHESPDGYHHGAMTEVEQGEGIIRMFETIRREGYAGGVIFAWMDEWAKKTWTTEPFMIPYEHNVFWHNAIDPEQNYGIVAMEPIHPSDPQQVVVGNGMIQRMEMAGNEAFFYLSIFFDRKVDLKDQQLLIGLDTYDAEKGTRRYREDISLQAPSGMEFMIQLDQLQGKLMVIPSYNIDRYQFASVMDSEGPFETINPIINSWRMTKDGRLIEEIREEASLLNQGPWEGKPNHWYREENAIYLRVPWGRLLVTDPTTYQVIHDSRTFYDYAARDEFQTVETEGFRVTVLLVEKDGLVIDHLPNSFRMPIEPFRWDSWKEPRYQKRFKASYEILQEYLER
ncbi:hypothetical protein [Anoxynatronum sibiricum]|uniref:Uncharacterized protein n=1 Tax=Anoxynatronum sibiricum TaxID=210623 RepID=A0ABU9VNU9_9CLOT